MSVNKVILVGNLGKDPDGSLYPDGQRRGKFLHRHIGTVERS